MLQSAMIANPGRADWEAVEDEVNLGGEGTRVPPGRRDIDLNGGTSANDDTSARMGGVGARDAPLAWRMRRITAK